jgi:hypothetical protein
MSWASVEEVAAVTGKTFSEETVALASSMIDTFSGADEEWPEDALSGVDRRHLRRATAWQCFFATKPGLVEERENASSITSDTQNIQREDRSDVMLHPLARRELTSLSWVGTRTAILPAFRPGWQSRNFLNESSDPAWFGS